MPVTWLTVGKLIVGNLDTIIGVSKPLFTRAKVASLSQQSELMTQQIAELQAASGQHAEQIHELAAQMKELVSALEQAAGETAIERARTRVWAVMAMTTSVIALLLAIAAMVARH